jgi:hypothetical protein
MMTPSEWVRTLFGLAFVLLVAVSLGAVIEGADPPRGYEAGFALFVALGVGAGLWALAEWRGKR